MSRRHSKKQPIFVTLGLICEGHTIPELIEMLQKAQDRADREGIEHVSIEISTERGYYDSVYVTVKLEGIRQETDEEYTLRCEQEQRKAMDNVAARRKLFDQLKREFGE